MKYLVTVIVALFIFGCSQKKVERESFSAEALTHEVLSLNGKKVAFSEVLNKHKGQNIVIEVWASWCGDCIKAMPKFKELQANHPEVDYVFISMDKTADKWKEGIEKHQLIGDHYMANDGMKGVFGKAMNMDWIPRYIIVDKASKVVTYRAIETDFDQMDDTLNSLK